MSDIVERLRQQATIEAKKLGDSVDIQLEWKAAEEITRLRARVEVLERACQLIQADPDPSAVVECTGCYRHSRLAYHALEAKP